MSVRNSLHDVADSARDYRDALLVLLGAVLGVGYDRWKVWTERRRRDAIVMAAIREEVAANRTVVENNQNLIATELHELQTGKRMINPLDPLLTGFWERVKVEPPQPLATSSAAMAHVREVARLTGQVNQMLRTRETTWALAFFPMAPSSPVLEALEKLDELIQVWQGQLIDALRSLAEDLD